DLLPRGRPSDLPRAPFQNGRRGRADLLPRGRPSDLPRAPFQNGRRGRRIRLPLTLSGAEEQPASLAPGQVVRGEKPRFSRRIARIRSKDRSVFALRIAPSERPRPMTSVAVSLCAAEMEWRPEVDYTAAISFDVPCASSWRAPAPRSCAAGPGRDGPECWR